MYSSDCVGDNDIRYDEEYTNSAAEQASVNKARAGFWIADSITYDGVGEPAQTGFWDPLNPTVVPYNQRPVNFFNATLNGSRMSEHIITVFQPASQDFCNQTVPPGFFNTLPPESLNQCGVTGFAIGVDIFSTTSYEKDGTMVTIPFEDDFDYQALHRSFPANDFAYY